MLRLSGKEVNNMPRPKTPEETHAFKASVSFLPEDYKRVISWCEKHDRQLSWVVRRAVNEWLDKHKDDPMLQ